LIRQLKPTVSFIEGSSVEDASKLGSPDPGLASFNIGIVPGKCILGSRHNIDIGNVFIHKEQNYNFSFLKGSISLGNSQLEQNFLDFLLRKIFYFLHIVAPPPEDLRRCVSCPVSEKGC